MTLSDYLAQQYPDAVPLRDYLIQDNGNGAYLARWNLPVPRPSKAELAAAGITEGRPNMSAMQDFQAKTTAQMANARAIIVATGETDLISLGGQIPALIAATADGDTVGDSTWSKGRAQEVSALWASFKIWLSTSSADPNAHGKTPLQILTAYDD